MAIEAVKTEVSEESVRYQARTVLAALALEIANKRIIDWVKVKKAAKIRYWLKALDYKEFLTRTQRLQILYKLIEISGVNDFPTSPILELHTRPNIGTGGGGGSGSLTSFSSGDLSPLFTTSVSSPTISPVLSFAAVNQSDNKVYASPSDGSSGAPLFRTLVSADVPNVPWSKITSTPTTLSGYGITDGQTTLVSGTNIKTVNGNSLLGSGNVSISTSWGSITGTLSSQSDLNSALSGKQPLDSDLTTIAGLTPSNDDFLQFKSSAWANRTIAQVKLDLGVVSLPTPTTGDSGKMLRVNTAENGYELFVPSSDPTTTDGDLIQRSGGVLARLAAVATGNALISGGVGTISSWGKIGLTTHVSGRLPFANLTQGSALSVLGVTGNATADFASIAAVTDGNVLRRSGTSLTFGSLDLTAAGTVGSSILPVANGGTGVSTGAWLLASGGALSANNSITGAFNLTFSNARFSRTGTYTATANNDFMFQYTGTFTGRATASDTFRAFDFTPTLVSGAATQNGVAFRIAPTFTATGGAFATAYTAQFVGTAGSVIVNSTGALVTDRGLSFDTASSAGANVLNFATGTAAQITASSSNNQLTFAGGSSTQANAASSRFFFSHTFAPVSGATNTALARFQQTVNQTGTANGVTTMVDYVLTPTAMVGNHTMLNITSSSGITLANTLTGLDYNPTITSVTTHYAALFRVGRVGIGTAAPTASLQIGAGSTAASTAPLKFTSGSLMTTAEAGAIEFLTDKLYATITTGAARKELTLNDASLTSGIIPVATTNGRITNSLASIDANGTLSNSNAAGTRAFFFDTTSATQTIYSVTTSGTVPNMLFKASNGISGSVTGADIIVQSGDAYSSGNNNSGNLYLNIGAPNGTGVYGNIGVFTTSGSFGSGEKVIFIANASVVPSSNPSGGGILYVESGALKYRGSSGTITTLGPA